MTSSGFDALMDALALEVRASATVFAGVDTFPFWFKRELVKHCKATGQVFTIWTMDEPRTSEIQQRMEDYLKKRFPVAKEIVFERSAAFAEEVTRLLIDLANDIEPAKM